MKYDNLTGIDVVSSGVVDLQGYGAVSAHLLHAFDAAPAAVTWTVEHGDVSGTLAAVAASDINTTAHGVSYVGSKRFVEFTPSAGTAVVVLSPEETPVA